MDFRASMLAALDRHCAATGLKPSTVATKAVNDGKFFERVREGGGFNIRTYERVMEWFRENAPPSTGAAA